jgi:hypothetical protein
MEDKEGEFEMKVDRTRSAGTICQRVAEAIDRLDKFRVCVKQDGGDRKAEKRIREALRAVNKALTACHGVFDVSFKD